MKSFLIPSILLATFISGTPCLATRINLATITFLSDGQALIETTDDSSHANAVCAFGNIRLNKAARTLLTGTTAASAASAALQPLDSMEIKRQLSGESYRDIYRSLGKTNARRMTCLWVGSLSTQMVVPPAIGLSFLSYSAIRNHLEQMHGHLSTLDVIAAGSLTGAIATSAVYPFDLIRTRVVKKNEGGIVENARHVFKQYGFPGFYRGIQYAYAAQVPSAAINFGAQHFVKQFLDKQSGNTELANSAIAGLVSGTAAKVVTIPLDGMRRRMQAGEARAIVFSGTSILEFEFLKNAYRGSFPSIVRSALFGAVLFGTFQFLRDDPEKDPWIDFENTPDSFSCSE